MRKKLENRLLKKNEKSKRKQNNTGYQKVTQRVEWQEGLFYDIFCGKGLNVASDKQYTVIR